MSEFDEFIAAGVDLCFYGTVDEEGILVGGTATAPANGNATGNVMTRLKAVQSADLSIPQPDEVSIGGDNRSNGTFTFASEDTPSFTLQQGIFQMILDALQQGTKVMTDGGTKMGVLAPNDYDPADMCWVLQSPAKKKNQGVSGLKGWMGYVIPISTGFPIGPDGMNTRAGKANRTRITTQPADKLFTGVPIDDTNFGTEGGCIVPFTNDFPLYFQRFTGDGDEDTFTLWKAPAVASAEQVSVYVDGVKKTYTTHYAVTGTSLVFTTGNEPEAGEKIVVKVGYRP